MRIQTKLKTSKGSLFAILCGGKTVAID